MRGFAASAVVLAHCSAYLKEGTIVHRFLSMGTAGVDFFFILSGFIIHYSYSDTQKTKFLDYLLHRFKRIYPIYWITTLIFVVLILIGNSITTKPVLEISYFSPNNILKNILLYPFPGWPSTQPINPVAWTLSFEILFYIIFSLRFISRRLYTVIQITWATVIIVNAQFHFIANSFLTSKYILLFLMGELIAINYLNYKSRRINRNIILVPAIFCILMEICLEINDIIQLRTTLFGLGFSLLIFYTITNPKATKRNNLVLEFLGDASYSIYLTHYWIVTFLFIGLFKFTETNIFPLYIIILVACLGIFSGLLTYLFVEKPLIRSKPVDNYDRKGF